MDIIEENPCNHKDIFGEPSIQHGFVADFCYRCGRYVNDISNEKLKNYDGGLKSDETKLSSFK